MAQRKDDLRNLTTCSVCMETYSDPRILSCIHTFCLRCLEKTAQNAEKAKEFPRCPLCRQAFRLPNEGVGAIPKNFFMENLIEMVTVARPDDVRFCGFCAADSDAASVPEAKVYCSECKEFICDECSRHHRKQTPTRNHDLIPLGTGVVPTEVTSQNKCDRHTSEQIKLFCVKCSCAVCILCFVESHASHECSDINKVVKEHRQQIQRNVEMVSGLLPKTINRIERVKESRTAAVGKFNELERRINARFEELRATIEDHRRRLLGDLAERKTRTMKQVDLQQSETERHQAILESFTTYCKELLSRASSVDVCRCSGDLRKRTSDLQQIHNSQFEKPVPVYDASFKKFDLEKMLNSERENILGKIEDNFAAMQKTESNSRDSQVAPKQPTNQTEFEFPEYWNPNKHLMANRPPRRMPILVPLERSQMFEEVTALLSKAVVNSFHQNAQNGLCRYQQQGPYNVYDPYAQNQTAFCQIQNIWSVQNPDLFRRYAAKKQLFEINSLVNDYVDVEQTIGSDVCTFKPEFQLLNNHLSSAHNERYLLFSTTANTFQTVADNGFQLTDTAQGTMVTGLGIHFVDSITIDNAKQQPSFAIKKQLLLERHHLYRPIDHERHSRVPVKSAKTRFASEISGAALVAVGADSTNYVFLSRVLLGNIFVCEARRHFDSLPCRVRGCSGSRCNHGRSFGATFDSIVGLAEVVGGRSRDFVILDPDQAYPEFLIQYSQ